MDRPDGGPEDREDARDSDDTPPRVIGTYPENGDDKVSIVRPLELRFDGALDPESLRDSIRLLGFPRRRGGLFLERAYLPRYPIEIDYEEGSEVVGVRPLYAMEGGIPHTLVVDGVLGEGGNAVEPFTVAFTPARSEEHLQWDYDGSGVLEEISVVEFEAGSPTFVRYYDGPGQDAQWNTGDDDFYRYKRYHQTASNNQSIYYDGIGDDGLWYTADDTISMIIQWFDDDTVVTSEVLTDPGEDGVWFTGDEGASYTFENSFYENGFRAFRRGYSTGADGVPRTADDEQTSYYRHVYEDDWLVGLLHVIDPGGDMLFETDDDVGTYREFIRDELGLVVQINRYEQVNASTLERDPSKLDGYALYIFDQDNISTAVHSFNDPGNDGDWYTGDDVQSSLARYERTASDLLLRVSVYNAGDDNAFGSGDDEITSMSDREFDDDGILTSYVRYIGPGEDGDWNDVADNVKDVRAEYVAMP